jgi:UDP-N-acetylglucosamine 3-dehydrogenase
MVHGERLKFEQFAYNPGMRIGREMIKPIKIGVVGLGAMGRQHVRVLRELPQFELVAIAEPRIRESPDVASSSGDVYTCPEVVDLLTCSLDAVVVASPTAFHLQQAELFLRAGLHVLVEKPIAVDVASARRLAAVATESGRSLLVGHIERFNPAIDALRALLTAGDLGSIVSISTRRVGVARPAAPSTNVIADLAIHDIDVIHLLTGHEPTVVGAKGGMLPGNTLEDFAILLLSYGSAAAAVEANWITPLKSRRMSVTGTGGFVDVDYIRQEVTVYEGRVDPVAGPELAFNAVWKTAEPRVMQVVKGEPLRRELIHFAECVRGECEPVITPVEAISALACCQEATEVIRRLPLDESVVVDA